MKYAQVHGLNNVFVGIWDLETEEQKELIRRKLRIGASMLMLMTAELRYDKMGLPASTRLDELLELIEETAMTIEVAARNE
jgi:hypothetical protein